MSDFGVTFTEDDGNELRPEGLVKLRVRLTGYKADQPNPQIINTKGGQALKVYFDIVEGEYKGCIVFSGYINFKNNNPQAQGMGRQSLKKLAIAVGLSGIAEFNNLGSSCLNGKILMANIHTYDDTYNGNTMTKTEIKTYFPKSDGANPASASETINDEIPTFMDD